MREFKKLDFPILREYYTKYPHGYTLYESLLYILERINELTDVTNLTLKEWVEIKNWVEKELSNYATDKITELLQNGQLHIDVDYEVESETLSFVFSAVTENGV